jgi:NAD+ diphosphatase
MLYTVMTNAKSSRPPIPFSGNPLDRASNMRRDADWVAQLLNATDSRFLPFWKLNVLSSDSDEAALHWLDLSVREFLEEGATPWLLGLQDGVAHFAVDLSAQEDPIASMGLEGVRFADARALASRLSLAEAGIIAHGRALVDWHRRHRFCGACGLPTVVREAGASRKCEDCGQEHFPRTDPVVIMVVWNGDKAVLGRQKAWPQGNYSALAGFIDQGETIEEAVKREVLEEVGIVVDDVEYHASQPWPFPSSLMIGCFAHTTQDEITIDPAELDTARWVTREEVQRVLAGPDPSLGFTIPGSIAIAHHLIRDWAQMPPEHWQ